MTGGFERVEGCAVDGSLSTRAPILENATGSAFGLPPSGVATPPDSVDSVMAPAANADVPGTAVALEGRGSGVDVNGGGNGPLPLLTLRLKGGSRVIV